MTVIDIPVQKGKKVNEKKESSNFEMQPGKLHRVLRQANNPLTSVAPPSGLLALPSGREVSSLELFLLVYKG